MKKYNIIICYEEEEKEKRSDEIIHSDWGKTENRKPRNE